MESKAIEIAAGKVRVAQAMTTIDFLAQGNRRNEEEARTFATCSTQMMTTNKSR